MSPLGLPGSVFRIKPGLFCLAFNALKARLQPASLSSHPSLPHMHPWHGSSPATRHALNFRAARPPVWLWCLLGTSPCCFSTLHHLYLCPCFFSPHFNVRSFMTANSFPCLSSLYHNEHPLHSAPTLWFTECCPPAR